MLELFFKCGYFNLETVKFVAIGLVSVAIISSSVVVVVVGR